MSSNLMFLPAHEDILGCFLSVQIYLLKAREIQKVAFASLMGNSHNDDKSIKFRLQN